ncbi:hypothetical protein HZS38_12895 [Xenorhabdus nematophila]|uniref:hypothetical protein n=1 Tax=Xenorhabdus nematophila TaxID=628 RepID=UPI000907B51F|nr:hypothetical protein [Xenorhabdus nematophila]AYA41267.1 hypothetical protein D3790_13130 [Xenorhabdus nematophila]MBA0020002.1 hypothetical protein [Xenorhabdus nematophila]MCB4423884.1 hypothetical protein [Xenorhabdus nematophila]QNJ38468.1 hypothetical protein H8F46_12880 [Xenorhabdus nematophila]
MKRAKDILSYFSSLFDQKSKMEEHIKKQEIIKKEKAKQLASEYVVKNFLHHLDKRGEEEIFQYAAQISIPYIRKSVSEFSEDWNEKIVKPAMDLYAATYSLISVLKNISASEETVVSVMAKSLFDDNYMSGVGMFFNYFGFSSQALTLDDVGVRNQVIALMDKPGGFARSEGSIQSRFISQIQKG